MYFVWLAKRKEAATAVIKKRKYCGNSVRRTKEEDILHLQHGHETSRSKHSEYFHKGLVHETTGFRRLNHGHRKGFHVGLSRALQVHRVNMWSVCHKWPGRTS